MKQVILVAALVVAYVQMGDLWLWREGQEAQRLAGKDVSRVMLAPGGARAAFTRQAEAGETLWVVDTDGQNAQQVGDFYINQFAWLDGDTLYFNTQRGTKDAAVAGAPEADDLWRADLRTGEVVQVLAPGEGGRFSIAPGGERLALVTPGTYGDPDAPAALDVVDPAGENRVEALRFPAVSTASQYAFYAVPHWLPDGSALRAAVPLPDAVYAAEGAPPVALWEITAAGEAQQIGEVEADYFSVVFNEAFWSPDGAYIAYTRRTGAPEANRAALCLAQGDGSRPDCVAEGEIGRLALLGWAPGNAFIYRRDDIEQQSMWRVEPGSAPAPFPVEPAYNLVWLDDETLAFNAYVGREAYLKLMRLSGDAEVIAREVWVFDAQAGR